MSLTQLLNYSITTNIVSNPIKCLQWILEYLILHLLWRKLPQITESGSVCGLTYVSYWFVCLLEASLPAVPNLPYRDGCSFIEEQPFLGYMWLWLVVAVSLSSVIQMPRLGNILIIFGHTWIMAWLFGLVSFHTAPNFSTNTGFGSSCCPCPT